MASMRVLAFAPLLLALAGFAAAPSAPGGRSGAEVVRLQCVLCHGSGIGGAPRIGDRAAWQRRARGGVDMMARSAAAGRGGMPPRGGLSDLTDAELRAAVVYMLLLSEAAEP